MIDMYMGQKNIVEPPDPKVVQFFKKNRDGRKGARINHKCTVCIRVDPGADEIAKPLEFILVKVDLVQIIIFHGNCSVEPCGTHSKGHFAPSMAVRLSPSVATDALSMGTTSPYR
jgi:hypothetical protein